MAKKNEVMSIEEQVAQQLALQTKQAAALKSGPAFVSFKGGQLIVDGVPIPNAEAEVVVLATQSERAYYEGTFDSSKPQVPVCYSFDGEVPHAEAAHPHAESCESCEKNKWGSANQGKGKGCRESVRVAIVPAASMIADAPMYQCSFPITSMKSVDAFLARAGSAGKLTGQFVARLKVVPDAKSFFKASLEVLRANDVELSALLTRMQEAREMLITPYPVFETEEVPTSGKY